MSITGIVTGEGVLLESDPASVLTRILSGLIDYGLYAVLLVVAEIAAAVLASNVDLSDDAETAVFIALVVVALLVAPITVETLTRGRSLGRLALGIRVVRDDGGVITVRHAVIRTLTAVIEVWATSGLLAVTASLFSSKGKRLGDMVAGTYAARVRGGPRDRLVVVMPPYLALWASRADVARLPDGLALAIRQFLGRAAKLHPGSRVRLGTALTEQAQVYVRPLPPAGTHPEDFLVALLAERRAREGTAELRRVVRQRSEADVLGRLPYGVSEA